MIDLKELREDPERVRASQRARGDDPALVDALLAADEARRSAVSAADDLRADQKSISASVRSATPEERPAVLERAEPAVQRTHGAEREQRVRVVVTRDRHGDRREREHEPGGEAGRPSERPTGPVVDERDGGDAHQRLRREQAP